MFEPSNHAFPKLLALVGVFASLAFAQSQNPSPSSGSTPPSSTPAVASSVQPASAVPPAPSASPPPHELNFLDADKLFREGDFDEAIDAYNSLIAKNAEPALAYAGLARVYLKRHQVSDAAAEIDKALDLAPTYPAVRTANGEVLFRQGKLADAEKEFVGLIRENTAYARAYLGMARISEAASYYKQAKRLIDYAHNLDPDDPDIRKFWLHTLSRDERIKALRDYLNAKNGDNAKERGRLGVELSLLEDEADQPLHPCRLASKVTSMQTDLKAMLYDPNHIRAYGLSVKLNGGTSATLMLDTGAGGILVDRRIAEKAGIRRVVETKIGGIGDKGDANGYIGYADSIQIGDLEFQNCYVEVIDQKRALGDDGLIGANVFSRFLVDLDFSNGKFRLSPLPSRPEDPKPEAALVSRDSTGPQPHDRYVAPEMKSYTPVYRFGHLLLLWTQVGKVPPKLFLLDTGAWANTISPSAAREVTKIYGDSNTTVKGLSGKVNDVFRANDVTLTFGHLRQENQDIVSFDTTGISDSAGTEISGTLGFNLLRMLDIKIDYRDGLVDLEFDKNRWHR